MDEYVGYIPRTLDQPEKFFLWEIDQFVLMVLICGVGITMGMMLSAMFIGVATAYGYGKLKSGKHPKFATHLMYWWLPSAISPKMQITPPSDYRYFLG